MFSRCWKPENYISQTPVRSCQWEEPIRDGKARGWRKQRALSASAADFPAAGCGSSGGPLPLGKVLSQPRWACRFLGCCSTPVWAVGPSPGMAAAAILWASPPPSQDILSPAPCARPLLLQAWRTVSVFLMGYSLIQMVLNEVINVKMLRLFF